MKLGEDVLLDIIDIVRIGIIEGKDISEMLRQIDVLVAKKIVGGSEADLQRMVDIICLTEEYREKRSQQS